MEERHVLILGAGDGVWAHSTAIEAYIEKTKPLVIALNTVSAIDDRLIDVRAASHPLRLLADVATYLKFNQPLMTPFSMLPKNISKLLGRKEILDLGLVINSSGFEFDQDFAVVPSNLVLGYVLCAVTNGKAKSISLAGFDGFAAGDPRTHEMKQLLDSYQQQLGSIDIRSITPTRYEIPIKSVYSI